MQKCFKKAVFKGPLASNEPTSPLYSHRQPSSVSRSPQPLFSGMIITSSFYNTDNINQLYYSCTQKSLGYIYLGQIVTKNHPHGLAPPASGCHCKNMNTEYQTDSITESTGTRDRIWYVFWWLDIHPLLIQSNHPIIFPTILMFEFGEAEIDTMIYMTAHAKQEAARLTGVKGVLER